MGSTYKLTSIVPAVMLASAVAMPVASNAADLLEPPVVEVPEVVTRHAGGWYLRGDITYDWQDINSPYAIAGVTTPYSNVELDDAFDIGLGIGYQIHENFRVDLTGEYVFEAGFMGLLPCADPACAPTGTSVEMANVSSFRLLANAYADLGSFNGVTPYIGAGIGGAYVSVEDYKQTDAAGNPVPPPGNPAGQSHLHRDYSSWRFAYALHAGFSYNLSHNLKLDLGYSYHNTADGGFAGYSIDNTTIDQPQIYDEGLESHVIRAGIRYHW